MRAVQKLQHGLFSVSDKQLKQNRHNTTFLLGMQNTKIWRVGNDKFNKNKRNKKAGVKLVFIWEHYTDNMLFERACVCCIVYISGS